MSKDESNNDQLKETTFSQEEYLRSEKIKKSIEEWESEWTPPATVFTGFCHRSYDERKDGWMREIKPETKIVSLAREIIDQHEEINELRREVWELRQRLKEESIIERNR